MNSEIYKLKIIHHRLSIRHQAKDVISKMML